MKKIKLLDCTLRDGGYYNNWDFSPELINKYVKAVSDLNVDMIEVGFLSVPKIGMEFIGGCSYVTDKFIESLNLPDNISDLAIMINGSELLNHSRSAEQVVRDLLCGVTNSRIKMVRLACHTHQVEMILPAVNELKKMGFLTAINLMQIAGLSDENLIYLSKICSDYPIDVLYFADSLGSMVPEDITKTVNLLRVNWHGDLGFHGHNNMELALVNALTAIDNGVLWIDSSVLGMGRGPGNVKTEHFAIELNTRFGRDMNLIPIMELINKYFIKMQKNYGWGSNSYYYMAGKFGIHPTYIQEMIGNSRYSDEDIFTVINHLKIEGGKSYSLDTMEAAKNFYIGEPRGTWSPVEFFDSRDILLLGTGPGVQAYRDALECFINNHKPFVIALNTQTVIDSSLIDARIACHPVRLLADCEEHTRLPQPLITPFSMLPEDVKKSLKNKTIYDYGISVKPETFEYHKEYCIAPSSLVIAYSLAVANSGGAKRIYLAGFDGYGSDDLRNHENNNLFKLYKSNPGSCELISITPTSYELDVLSVHAMLINGVFL